MIAARKGHIKTVQRLLELGANVNCKEKVSYLVEVVFLDNVWHQHHWLVKSINTHCKLQLHTTPSWNHNTG